MQCPKCNFAQDDRNTECSRCGLIFKKFQASVDSGFKRRSLSKPAESGEEPATWKQTLKGLFLDVKPDMNPFYFYGRLGLFLVLFIWGWIFIFSPLASDRIMNSFWHLVNLPFHEAGHIFFRLFGRWITSLGGSLFQLLMPVICAAVLLLKTRDAFGGAVSLWWLAENFMDLAPYINDARTLQLPLLGGNTGESSPYGFHDWEFILTECGLLRYDHAIAHISHILGIVLMILSFVWGGYLLFRQYQNLE